MTVIFFLEVGAAMMIWMVLIRLFELSFPNSGIAKAMGVIH